MGKLLMISLDEFKFNGKYIESNDANQHKFVD